MSKEEMEANRRRWNEVVRIHTASKFYDVEGFKRGNSSLLPVEQKEVGEVSGKRLLHLQCHFGLDTLSWARKGAQVTGVDYSEEAVRFARGLAQELGIEARFVESNVLDLDSVLDERFDIVFTSYGVLCWLPDLRGWARTIADHLEPDGFFYIVEDHPLAAMIDENGTDEIRLTYPYFSAGAPLRFDQQGTYTDRSAEVVNATSYEWVHTLSDIVDSLLEVGLRIEFLHEFPFSFFPRRADMKQRPDGTWAFPDPDISFPMMFSIKART